VNATGAREALDGAVTAISAAGCQTPRLDAEVLLAHVLGVPRERLYTDRELTLVGSTIRDFQQAIRRRAIDREPVAYITGVRAFRNIDLAVDRRALIPRPETELLVEAALGLPAGTRVLDLCTGCGAVALALAQERPDLELTGSDLSQDALELARTNAGRLGLDVRWMHADLLEGLDDDFRRARTSPTGAGDRPSRAAGRPVRGSRRTGCDP
jgi:release factor glutamine methyltransferase